ncbi:MAG TPA: hypothetical protein VG457_13710, partial [Planctomycetota bacterium]|nr:hypothetical protein [Planctomycetota bacterium]
APAVSSFAELESRMGQQMSALDADRIKIWTKDWADHVEFDPMKTLQTMAGSFASFWSFGRTGHSLMTTTVGYQLDVAPFVNGYRAAKEWEYADDQDEAREAQDQLQKVVRDRASLGAQMLMYATGVPFFSSVYQDAAAGKLDSAVGKGIVYGWLFGGSTLGFIRYAKGNLLAAKDRVTNFGKPVEMSPLGATAEGRPVWFTETEAVPVDSVAGELPSLGARGVARAYQGVGAAWDFLADGANLIVRPISKGIGWVYGNTVRRNISLDPAKPGIAGAEGDWLLTPDEVRDILSKPQGRTQFLATRGKTQIPIDVSNEDLRKLAESEDPVLRRNFAKRLGLEGPETDRIVRGLQRAMKVEPSAAVAEVATGAKPATLGELMSRLTDSRIWRVTVNGKTEEVMLSNSELVRMVDAYFNSPVLPGQANEEAFQNLLFKTGRLRDADLMRAIVMNYRGEAATAVGRVKLAGMARRASVISKAAPGEPILSRARYGRNQGDPLLTARAGNSTVHLNEGADGELHVSLNGEDID